MKKTDFDDFSLSYDTALDQGLSASGEDKEYFAEGRIRWLATCLRPALYEHVLDFGCGTGTSVSYLFEVLKARQVLGLDISKKSLDIARQQCGAAAEFRTFNDYQPDATIDLAFCNGVFHHIPIQRRQAQVGYVYRALRSGGIFAFWENNPWNPGTRYVMSRIPFDRDAVTLTPIEARRLLRSGGFEILRTDFMFIFPKVLRQLRWIEPLVSRLPLGGQYQVLCRKP